MPPHCGQSAAGADSAPTHAPTLQQSNAAHPARGEIVILAGPPSAEDAPQADPDALLRAALATHSLKEAVAQVTAATGLPRRQVYARALALAPRDAPGAKD